MKIRMKLFMLACFLGVMPLTSMAANSVLSGIFDGSESLAAPLPGTCGGTTPLGYQEVGNFQVSASGIYTITDAYNYIGVDIMCWSFSFIAPILIAYGSIAREPGRSLFPGRAS